MGVDPEEIIATTQADAMVGGRISSYTRAGRIKPIRKLPGKTGALLFLRADVERLAEEIRQELADRLARIDAAS